MGTLRRECLDHFVFPSEKHLRRVVTEFITYSDEARPHQGIEGIPDSVDAYAQRPPPPGPACRLEARPILGGVHHDYRLAA